MQTLRTNKVNLVQSPLVTREGLSFIEIDDRHLCLEVMQCRRS
jgi:hypothetical protein